MKRLKLAFLAIFLLSTAISFGQAKSTKDFIGKWENEESAADKGSLEFLDSTHVNLTIKGRKLPPATYTVDFSKSPYWLDITIGQGEQKKVLKSLIQFVDRDNVKWQIFPVGDRGKDFTEASGSSVVLTRKR